MDRQPRRSCVRHPADLCGPILTVLQLDFVRRCLSHPGVLRTEPLGLASSAANWHGLGDGMLVPAAACCFVLVVHTLEPNCIPRCVIEGCLPGNSQVLAAYIRVWLPCNNACLASAGVQAGDSERRSLISSSFSKTWEDLAVGEKPFFACTRRFRKSSTS